MKKQFLIVVVSALMCTACNAQSKNKQHPEMKKIEQTIHSFAKAGDDQDATQLDHLLDPNYRIVMNRLFGSPEVTVMPKSLYLDKISSKEFGGDKRDVMIHELIINNTIASAKVTFKGEEMTFISSLQLLQNADGDWKLISDTPYVQ